jgi:hypothetical protein
VLGTVVLKGIVRRARPKRLFRQNPLDRLSRTTTRFRFDR